MTTGVGAGCGGLRATPQGKDAGPDRTAADGSAGKDTGKDTPPTPDAPGDLSPADVPAMDAPVERPPDVPPMDAPVDMPADVPPMDAPMEMPPACGNGRLDPGETCDPLSTCPTACPAQGCQLRSLTGAGTCQAACVAAGTQTACMNSDGCCPTGCNAINDTDCPARCGNGVVEPGEMCDGNCPATCPAVGCQQRTLQGSAATCDARCVNAAVTTACTPNDSCCPSGCNATNDADCVVRCGNGVVEAGELCDGNCPTSCAAVGCQLRVPMGDPAACNVQCVNGSLQTTCANADSCCPSACNSLNDSDCQPVCGNGVVERAAGETCDPPSACTTQMTACVSDANFVRTSSGSVSACTYVCTATPRACGPADTFCPTGCGPTMDVDCPGCGNGRVETGETCDPPSACMTQMTACVSDANNVRTSSGSVSACTYVCTTRPRTCGPSDTFCPTGCGPTMDVDCPGCGNGRIEAGESCDVAPAGVVCSGITCNDSNACTTDTRTGADATCNVGCTHTAITACTSGDGCCPGAGQGACNRNNDTDCAAVCGNGAVEMGETCDTAIANSCPTSCAQLACVLPALVNRGTCTAACVDQGGRQTACVDGDGCCPAAPSNCSDINDTDCATPNDTCANARDISAGGDFPFSLMTAKAETPGQCTPDGPEVFFGFTLAAPSAVYLDVFDPTGKRVDVALEVWANNCPVAGSKPLVCNFDGGGACGGETWPRVFFTNTDLRTFVVAARATNGTRGRYTLRFQYVPLACIAAGAFPLTATQPLVDTTCGNADQYAPSCATPMTGGLDKTFYLVKCPAQTLSLSTCEGRTGNTDTVLLVNRGSMRVANGVCSAVPGGIGREIACNDERTGACAANPNNTHTSQIAGAGAGERGIFTISVDTKPIVGAANCGPFGLNWALQ